MNREEIALVNFKQGLNCAQSVFCVFAPEGGLSREKALLVASCFGGGMRCGEVCGAVTGALMAIGLNFGFTSVQNPADKARSNALAVSFEEQFIAKKQSILCRELLGYNLSDSEEFMQITEKGLFSSICPQLISEAVRLVEKILKDEKKEPIQADRF